MERYLFKAKDYNSIWRTGLLIALQGDRCAIEEKDRSKWACDSKTLCQCTGLKDKNGKLIWENDIVKIGGFISTVNGEYKVFFDTTNHCWALSRNICYHDSYFTFSDLNGFSEDCEVIGNELDNSELQEEEKCLRHIQ